MEVKLLDKSEQPIFVSVGDAARLLGISEWTVKQELRRGRLRARKAGRRTVVEYASVLALAESLPKAKFAPPRKRGNRASLEVGEAR